MVFNPTQPFKIVDGENINLTAQEMADIAAAEAIYVPPPPPLPDLATQLAAALISNGTIQLTDISSIALTQVNDTLTSIGKPAITEKP